MPGGPGAVAASLAPLREDFGERWSFSTVRVWDHWSLTASRHGGTAGPGVVAVITPDPEEMRAVLREDGIKTDPG